MDVSGRVSALCLGYATEGKFKSIGKKDCKMYNEKEYEKEKKEKSEQQHPMTEKEARVEKGELELERRNEEAGPVGKKWTKSVDETRQGTEWVRLGSTDYTAIDLVPGR